MPHGNTHQRGNESAASVPFFFVGLAATFVIWGLQLIGITIDVFLGAIVLAFAFALMVYAFWVWETVSSWRVSSRLAIVCIVAVIYSVAAGKQVAKEWRVEHPVQIAVPPELPPPFSINTEALLGRPLVDFWIKANNSICPVDLVGFVSITNSQSKESMIGRLDAEALSIKGDWKKLTEDSPIGKLYLGSDKKALFEVKPFEGFIDDKLVNHNFPVGEVQRGMILWRLPEGYSHEDFTGKIRIAVAEMSGAKSYVELLPIDAPNQYLGWVYLKTKQDLSKLKEVSCARW